MRLWRLTAFALAILAFVVTAIRPEGIPLFGTAAGQGGLRVGRMVFFWIGVAGTLAAVWGRGI